MVSRPRVVGLIVPLTAIAVWQLLVSADVLDYEYLPAPREVADALDDLVRSGELADDLAHTLGVALAAAVITLTVGGALGLLIGLVPTLRTYLMASIDVLRTIPAVALVPVAVLTFGPAVTTELILAVYAALWPVLIHTAAGVAAVHPRQYDVARTLHIPRAATVRKVVIPAVVPAWLVGARVAAVVALLVAIAAEMISSPRGLGGGLIESLNALAPARMWAYALVAGIVGYLLNTALREVVRSGLPSGPAHAARATTNAADHVGASATTPLRGLVPLATLLIGWQLVASDDSLSFPPPGTWFGAIARMYDEGVLLPAIGQTLTTFVVALALAAFIGAAVGIAIGASPWIDRTLSPTVDFLAAVPGAAFVPVAVLILGTSPVSGVAVVALVVSWPILLNTATAMRAVPAVRLDMSRTLGLSTGERWRKVILPTLAPGIMLGVRVAASMALIITLLVDILGAGEGIGRLLVESQQKFDARAVWGLLLIVGTVGYLTSATLARVAARGHPPPDERDARSI
ncbi:ABC transporter permease [Rhodococcus koreensis]